VAPVFYIHIIQVLKRKLTMSVAVFTFGRFNPPTIGHVALANKIKSVARKNGAQSFIFTGKSTDKKRNPLDYNNKILFMSKSFKGVTVVKNEKINTIFDALGYLDKKGYTDIKLVVGSDRTGEFKKLVSKYLKDYNFENFEVVSAGERDPDAGGVKGMSASKMRAAAERGDYDAFRLGCSANMSKKDCLKMFKAVQKGMGVKEHIEESWFNYDDFIDFTLNERKVSIDTRRKMARTARRTAKKRAKVRKRREKFRKSSTQLKALSRKKAKDLLRKKILGDMDWSSLSLGQRASVDKRLEKKAGAITKIAKKLLPKVKMAEKERLIKVRARTPGQPKKPEVKEDSQFLREPEILDRLVTQLKDKGMDNDKAHAVARSQLQKHGILKQGSDELTDKGKKRNSMTPAERAKDRAAKKDGNSSNEYKYNKKTNIATKEEVMFSEAKDKPLIRWMDDFEKHLKKAGSSYKNIKPTDALELYYKGIDPKQAAAQLKEATNTMTMMFSFSNDRKAKQFEYDISNSAVAVGTRVGNKVEVDHKEGDKNAHKALLKYMKKSGGKLIENALPEDTFKKKAVRDVEAKYQNKSDVLKKRIEDLKKKMDSNPIGKVKAGQETLDDLKARQAKARKKREDAEERVRAATARLKATRAKLKDNTESVELDEGFKPSTYYSIVYKGKVTEKGNKKQVTKKIKQMRKEDPTLDRKDLFIGITSKPIGAKWPKRKGQKESVELDEAETLHWNKLKRPEKEELLGKVGFPKRFASDKWNTLDFRAKEKLGKMITKTTNREYRLAEQKKRNLKDFIEDRDYKKEYANFHGKPEQRAKRSKRVLARRKLEAQGRVKKGDGKDVDHRDGNANNNSDSNLRVLSQNHNRSRDNNKGRIKTQEEHGAGEWGTPELIKRYKDFTPGEDGKQPVEPTPKVKKKKVKPPKTSGAY